MSKAGVVAVFLAALVLAGPAGAFTRTSVIAAANQVRVQYGEPPLRTVPYRPSDGGFEVEPAVGERTPLEAIGNWTELLAQLIDPRVETAATRAGLGGVVQLELGPPRPGRLAGAIVPRRIDPALPIDIAVLLPARGGRVDFAELRGDAWSEVPAQIETANGVLGSQVVDIQLDRPAYGSRYKLVVGGRTYTFRTASPAAAFVAKTWTFGPTMTPAAVTMVQQAFASAPPFVQELADALDGGVTFELEGCVGGDPGDSCMRQVGNTFRIDVNPADATPFTVLHEFGHVVDAVGLDVAGELAIQKLFTASPDWNDCFFYRPLGCVPPDELFADQFAYAATGVSPADVSYGDPPLVDPGVFAALLLQQFAFRPGYAADPSRAEP